MPIQFNCTHCNHSLSVSSKLAGKRAKCPKCQGQIQIPHKPADGAATRPGTKSKGESAVVAKGQPKRVDKSSGKRSTATAVGGSNDSSLMSSLLDEVGLVQKTGPVCPSCGLSIRPGTVVCTSCGFHLETKKKMTGYDARIERPEFDNLHLQQAVNNMSRETEMDSRREKSAMPWWVLASFLIGAVILCGAGVVLVDANFGEPAPENTRLGRIQRVPVLVILGTTVGVTGLALALFAHLNICVFGFQKKLMHGIGCFFLPLIFSIPYGIKNWTSNKAPVKGLILAIVFISIGAGLIISGGGFDKLNGVL